MSRESNRDFVRSTLYAIATAPSLRDLNASLVLKGGIALMLRYDSDRVSQRDMDFGLTHTNHRLTQVDSDNLLVELAEWTAQPVGSRTIRIVGESIDTPRISYIHPRTLERGELTLQTSGLQVPPVLATEILSRGLRPFTTYDGKPFRFRVLELDEIAAEKMCRLWRQDKRPPRLADLYDIGFCAEQSDFNMSACFMS